MGLSLCKTLIYESKSIELSIDCGEAAKARTGKKMPLLLNSPGFEKVEILSRTFSGLDVRYIEKYPIKGQSCVDMRSDRPSLLVRLCQRGGLCEPRFKPDEPTPRDRHDVGFFNWIPAGEQVWCFSDNVQFLRDLHISFDESALKSLLADDCEYSKLNEPRLLVYEPRVKDCARLLADMLVQDEPCDRLFGESIAMALLASTLAFPKKRPERGPANGLLPWQLRLAKDYLEDNFNRNVGLEEVANLTGLSRSWFARGFRGSTGIAPYSFILQIRVRKAKEFLLDQKTPIATIATLVGFADQSHFTKIFRRYAGATPREWRETQKR
jgi:AraC family transcriptional regulator